MQFDIEASIFHDDDYQNKSYLHTYIYINLCTVGT